MTLNPSPNTDPRVDTYIAAAAAFAQPILATLRKRVHQACPDVVETIKWGFPHFMYREKILCGMAAFKAHCALGFWQADVLKIPSRSNLAMGDFGRLTSTSELPTAGDFSALVKQAMANIAEGRATKTNAKTGARPHIVAPAPLLTAIKQNPSAKLIWQDFSPTKKKDYADWINEAKREATKQARIAQAVDWIAEGKSRNWKYERPKSPK